MSGSWPVWIALVCLVSSHVFMFALGVAAYHSLRWINMRPVVPKPQMSEQKMVALADQIARRQAQQEQFAWLQRNQTMSSPAQVEEIEEEQKFAPSKK